MKRLRSALSLLIVFTVLMSFAGCGHTSRRSRRSDRDRDRDREETTETTEDLVCETDFGTYTIGYGWVEVEAQRNAPDNYTYCEAGNEDSRTPPNNLWVSHGTNYYAIDEGDDFCTAILQQVHGQAAQFGGTAQMTEYGTFGENEVYRFDLVCEDFTTIQWYVVGDYEYVMFSLAIYDEDEAEDDHCMDVAEEAVNSFEWNS